MKPDGAFFNALNFFNLFQIKLIEYILLPELSEGRTQKAFISF